MCLSELKKDEGVGRECEREIEMEIPGIEWSIEILKNLDGSMIISGG